MIAVIVLVVLIAASVAAVLLVRRNKQKRIAAMSPAERELHEAQLEYEATVKAAEKDHAREVKAREKRLKVAEVNLSTANAIGNRRVGGFRGTDGAVSFTGTTITVSQGTFPLTTDITAVADTAGNLATSSRTTLTRVAAGGLLLGPAGMILGGVAKKNKIHDTRELYLLVEAPDRFASLISCNPDDGQKVRQVAMGIKQAALNVNNTLMQRQQAIAAAENDLYTEQQDSGALSVAAAALESARKNTGRVTAAQRALPAAPADPSGTNTAA